jgi:glycerophosphoryl diester phosphodiesterase
MAGRYRSRHGRAERPGGAPGILPVVSTPGRPPRTGYPYLDRVLDQPGSVLALAHRGGAYHPELEGLENTLAAFRHAAALGYDYLETDVHVTSDGVLLAFHDRVLDRVTDHTGAVAEMTLAEVRRARVGGREEVPTLAALFDAIPDACFNIDVKTDGAVRAFADFVAARAAWHRVLAGSFSQRRTDELRRLTEGRMATAATPAEAAAFRALPSGRLARRLTGARVPAVQVPHFRRGVRIVTPGLVRRVHAAGAHVHVWTVDDPAEMHELLDRGVDGIITDRTDILRDVLISRGQWRGATGVGR